MQLSIEVSCLVCSLSQGTIGITLCRPESFTDSHKAIIMRTIRSKNQEFLMNFFLYFIHMGRNCFRFRMHRQLSCRHKYNKRECVMVSQCPLIVPLIGTLVMSPFACLRTDRCTFVTSWAFSFELKVGSLADHVPSHPTQHYQISVLEQT